MFVQNMSLQRGNAIYNQTRGFSVGLGVLQLSSPIIPILNVNTKLLIPISRSLHFTSPPDQCVISHTVLFPRISAVSKLTT